MDRVFQTICQARHGCLSVKPTGGDRLSAGPSSRSGDQLAKGEIEGRDRGERSGEIGGERSEKRSGTAPELWAQMERSERSKEIEGDREIGDSSRTVRQ